MTRSTFAATGAWLRERRRSLDLTQEALAERVGCSAESIRKIEADERRPSRRLAERLADKLGIPAQEREAFLEAARSIRAAERLPLDSLPVHEGEKEAAPFVGRGAEFGLLIGLLARLTAGSGHVALLEGEPGIGKSRLLHELDRYCAARGLCTLATNCYEIERAMAYQPVIDLVGKALELAPNDWDTRYNYELTRRLLAELRKQPKTPPKQMMQLLRPQPKTGNQPAKRIG